MSTWLGFLKNGIWEAMGAEVEIRWVDFVFRRMKYQMAGCLGKLLLALMIAIVLGAGFCNYSQVTGDYLEPLELLQ